MTTTCYICGKVTLWPGGSRDVLENDKTRRVCLDCYDEIVDFERPGWESV